MQACLGCCRCKYIYSGTVRHEVYALHEVGSLDRFHQWFHDSVVVPSTHKFNEALLNVYSHDANENIPWHSDKADLYSDEMDVMAMNLGAPGIYCFGPRQHNRTIWPQLYALGGSNWSTWRQSAIDAGFRGMLPVRAGDLTLTTGTWHLHFDHKTQKPTSIWSDESRAELFSSYPATSPASRKLFLRFEMPDDSTLRDRACITFRRIEHHNPWCVEENAMRSERSSEPILEEAAPPSPPRYPHPPSAPPPSAQVRLKRISATIDDTPAYVDLFCEPSVATVAKASAEQLTSHTADGNYLKLCDLESMLEKADASSACAYSLASYTTAQTWQNKEAVALHQEAYNKLEELKSWNGSRNAWIKLPFTNDQTHPLFRKGVTSSNVTALRLLLKVGSPVEYAAPR